MRVEQLGEGDPEIAVVAGVHGDEPCGVRAVERLLAERPTVQRPVAVIVANEEALDEGRRYLDADLNRSFPGDPDAPDHEARLAHRLAAAVADCTVLSLHSTQSHAEPFAIVDGVDETARRICPRLSVAAVVDAGRYVDGRLFAADATVIEVEAGLQGSDAAAENASRLVREFLVATGVLPGESPVHEVPVFHLTRTLHKSPAETYEVFVSNFERVAADEVYAAADGDSLRADEPFYPVLLSAYGYRDVFGYGAEAAGTIP